MQLTGPTGTIPDTDTLHPMRWIYLSPHFDDAVLSCGGLIFDQSRQGIRTEVWTVMAGNPPAGPLSDFARENHALWGLPGGKETVAMRRSEDEEAARRVGAKLVHLDFPDCIYRRSPTGEVLYNETVMTSPHPDEANFPAQIAGRLRPQLKEDDLLVCPLALGGHVDHILVRKAAERLQRPIRYYADVPYILNYPETLEPALAGLEDQLYPLKESDLTVWLAGVSAYRSQLASLYKGVGSLQAAIRSYWAGLGGIRMWMKGPDKL